MVVVVVVIMMTTMMIMMMIIIIIIIIIITTIITNSMQYVYIYIPETDNRISTVCILLRPLCSYGL